jgi:hypothetical protein
MRARLDEEMGAPPPPTIDIDAVMSRGRRQLRLRRFGVIGGGAGLSVVALGAAVAVAIQGTGDVTGGARDGVAERPSGSVPSSSAQPGEMLSPAPTDLPSGEPGGSRLPRPAMTPQTDREKEMSVVVRQIVAQYAPGYTAARDTSGRGALEVGSGAWRNSRETTFEASADITVGGGTGNFYISIGRARDGFINSTTCAELGTSPTRECAGAIGRAGEKILKITENSYGGRSFIVYITRRDGTGVALIADDGNEHNTRTRTRATPVFSHEQLVWIGSDPRWTV